jgi:prepilin-type N-terminal cleavage/methylation domain-containing protein
VAMADIWVVWTHLAHLMVQAAGLLKQTVPVLQLCHKKIKSENMSEQKKFSKGFTIIELIVVIAIIAILAAIVMVNVVQYIQRSQDAAALSDLQQMETFTTDFFANGGNE